MHLATGGDVADQQEVPRLAQSYARRSVSTRCTTSRSPEVYPGAAGSRPIAVVAFWERRLGTSRSAPVDSTAASATLAVPANCSTWSLGVGTGCLASSDAGTVWSS